MKINREYKRNDDKRTVTVTLESDEELVAVKKGQTVLTIDDSLHYKLGAQLGDVVPGHALSESVAVSWCPHSQTWIE